MVERYGLKAPLVKAPPFISHYHRVPERLDLMQTIILNSNDQMSIKDKSILLVEDNDNDAMMTQRALRKSNILNKVVWAKDGAEALDYLFTTCLEQGEKLPQLILLDIHMPKVNGIE